MVPAQAKRNAVANLKLKLKVKNYYRLFLLFGSFFGLTGVALGAFGAHALKSVVFPEMLSAFETGVRYQLYHAFALMVTALLHDRGGGRFGVFAGWFFIAGIVLFSGSLYTLAVSGVGWIGMITPFGGMCFLAGWLALFAAALKIKKEN